MSQRSRIVDIAIGEIGYKETGNNNTKYGQWYGMNNAPWCAMFVSWCAFMAKIPISVVPKLAYVPYIYKFFYSSERFKGRGYTPRPGDLVLYGENDHVGIVERVSGGTMYTIEGNTSAGGNVSNGEGVYRRKRSLSSSWIKGFCVPDYEEEEELKPIDIKIKDLTRNRTVSVPAVNVDGYNYIKLRDVEKIAPIAVSSEGAIPTVKVNYKE